jgi:uncharacterized protein YegP (UPF0339 family)
MKWSYEGRVGEDQGVARPNLRPAFHQAIGSTGYRGCRPPTRFAITQPQRHPRGLSAMHWAGRLLKATNGQVIATSGRGYKNKADCEHAIDVIKQGAKEAKVEEWTIETLGNVGIDDLAGNQSEALNSSTESLQANNLPGISARSCTGTSIRRIAFLKPRDPIARIMLNHRAADQDAVGTATDERIGAGVSDPDIPA